MKNFRKIVTVILLIVLFTSIVPSFAFAGNTQNVTMSVGESKTLYASSAYRDGQWTSSHRAVSVVSQSRSSCTVRVEEYTSSSVVVHCWYTKPVSNGRYTYYVQDYQDYVISIKEPVNVTISFDANEGYIGNGQYIINEEYTSGGTYGTLPTPTRSGYRFVGWFTKQTGGSKVTSSSSCNLSDANSYTQASCFTAFSIKSLSALLDFPLPKGIMQ